MTHRLTRKDAASLTGDCAACGPGVAIRWETGHQGRRYLRCTTAKYEHRSHHGQAKRTHGLTDREARAYRAGKACAICGSADRLTVDHCHRSGRLRGVLCNSCNQGLGSFRDDPALLAAAIAYLRVPAPG